MKIKLFAALALLAGTALTGTAAQAADITAAAPYDWTGMYIGAQGGWSWLDPNSSAPNLHQPSSNGIAIGLNWGYNYQINSLVMGLESDFNFTDLSKTVPCANAAFACNASSDWNTSIRARLGVAADRLLMFGTAGYALADYNGFTDNGTHFADSTTAGGFTYGAGLEYAWTDNLLVRAEYRHIDLGKETMFYDIAYPVKPDIDMVLVGASWKF